MKSIITFLALALTIIATPLMAEERSGYYLCTVDESILDIDEQIKELRKWSLVKVARKTNLMI